MYAGGVFTEAGGSPANYIAKWNGRSWSALGSGVNNTVYALAVSGSGLYAGGRFTAAGGKVSAYVAEAAFVVPSPVVLQSPVLTGGVFSAWFTNAPGASFRVVGTTNLSLPVGTHAASRGCSPHPRPPAVPQPQSPHRGQRRRLVAAPRGRFPASLSLRSQQPRFPHAPRIKAFGGHIFPPSKASHPLTGGCILSVT